MKHQLLTIALLFSVNSFAQHERHIHFNGEHLDPESISIIDLLYGFKLVDGYYWINMETGEWGVEGNNRVQGVLSLVAQSQQQATEPKPSRRTERAEINTSQNGSVVTGKLDGKNCTFVSVGGMTMKSCD